MKLAQFKAQIVAYATAQIPFIFMIDFELAAPRVYKLAAAAEQGLYYNFKGSGNCPPGTVPAQILFDSSALKKELFTAKFNAVQTELKRGNVYLLNLTFASKISTNLSLKDIFLHTDAAYKLLYKDQFVTFSPECFIKISDGKISTYPMKGTIDAELENARQILLDNKKEQWEHNTIVDLMRNELAKVGSKVRLEKYRYLQQINTHKGAILQSSSVISARLAENWQQNLGDIILQLLPAGSINGAPKQIANKIIRRSELDARGYYSGVFGIFDGKNLDSAVAIRYIEKKQQQMYFRSGGGITAHSNASAEYKELQQKISLPLQASYPLLETICIQDGRVQNLDWHQRRYQQAYKTYYQQSTTTSILQDIEIPQRYLNGMVKLRISYNKTTRQAQFERYRLQQINSLKIVSDNSIDYSLKYSNRQRLKQLFAQRGNCDDILIIKNNMVGDSSSANIVFFDGKRWLTPNSALLKGTQRARLLAQNLIHEAPISRHDIKNFISFKLINALRDFNAVPAVAIENIVS